MTPTNKLRFVERPMFAPDGPPFVRVLQQWWAFEVDVSIGEWRDVRETMTDLRTAAQQALDFIRAMNSHGWLLADYESDMERTVADLEAALAQEQAEPVQEPVGTVRVDAGEVHIVPVIRDADRSALKDGQPVYTAPPEFVPLTEEEIDELAMDEEGLPNSHLEFARAIEQALKEKNR